MYPVHWRTLAAKVYEHLGSIRKAAVILNIHYSTLSRWILSPERKKYFRSHTVSLKSDVIIETVRDALIADPFLTVRKLQNRIASVFKFTVSKELVRIAIARCSFTLKKAKRFSQPSNNQQKTDCFLKQRQTFVDQGYSFFSLDETSFGRNGLLSHGYSPKGQPLVIQNKLSRITTTSVMALASSEKLVKTTARHGSFDTATFVAFLQDVSLPEKSVILLDNVRFHHAARVKETASAKGVQLLYVPPYSPWFNPIEGIFSIVKRHYYIHSSIDEAFQSVTKRHCEAFFRRALAATSRK